MSINVTYPADYPAVEVCGPNPSLARLLNNDLSAAKSEMTAIHQYTYQAWRLEKDYPEISKTLSGNRHGRNAPLSPSGTTDQPVGGNSEIFLLSAWNHTAMEWKNG